jgi:hypothetical protein
MMVAGYQYCARGEASLEILQINKRYLAGHPQYTRLTSFARTNPANQLRAARFAIPDGQTLNVVTLPPIISQWPNLVR